MKRTVRTSLMVSVAVLWLGGCAQQAQVFSHEFTGTSVPWTDRPFDDAAEKFTFAVFSDLNGGEREGVFATAVSQLSLLRPELIVSVGDLIDGGSEDRGQLAEEWRSFDARASAASAPVFYVGGNHDLTNPTMREVWVERYGARYYHVVYKNVLFLMLDSEDYTEERMREIYLARAEVIELLSSDQPERARESAYNQMPERVTGAIGKAQADYFLRAIADHPDVDWTFMFMHKPVWRNDAEAEFAAIESALADRPYTYFNGHLHTYSHTTRHGRDYINLGTTGGAQRAGNPMSFDHVTLVTMDGGGPTIANLKMDGILDRSGGVPE